MNNENQTINSPDEYIMNQPSERREILEKLRKTIKSNLPEGFTETMQYGMISFVVPHNFYPAGYHVNLKEPLPFIALANQKGYIALYHMGIYMDEPLMKWFSKSYASLDIGKLDMGKSCIRFKNMDKIPYELITELCSKMSVEEYVLLYKKNKPEKK